MIPIFAIVGASKSGKTTLMEKIVGELKKRNYRVAVIKHDVHGFEIDHKGRDTYRIREAGSDITIISSPEKLALVEKREEESNLEEIIANHINNIDIILLEGYKSHPVPKVEIKKEGQNIITQDDEKLLAIISDEEVTSKLPVIKRDDFLKVVELIEKEINKNPERKLKLYINGNRIPLKNFIHTMFVEIIIGMLKSLKGMEKAKDIIIKLNVKN